MPSAKRKSSREGPDFKLTHHERRSRCRESKGVVQSRSITELRNPVFLRIFERCEWVPPPPPINSRRCMSDNKDEYPSVGEQAAFSEAYDLAKRLAGMGYGEAEIGKEFLVAAMGLLRKSLGNEATAKIMYEFADDYSVRTLEGR